MRSGRACTTVPTTSASAAVVVIGALARAATIALAT
jgi:hypothetical protein